MGEIAEELTDSNLDLWAEHLAGICGQDCAYCESEFSEFKPIDETDLK